MTEQTGPVGARILRKEDQRLITGKGTFIEDLLVNNSLSAVLVRSTMAHGAIRHIDASAALNAPGVIAVFSGSDLSNLSKPLSMSAMPFVKQAPWHALAVDRVRYVGEPLAVVVAANQQLGEDARDLVEIGFESMQAVVDVEKAIEPDSPLLYPDWGDNVMLRLPHEAGSLDAAFASADVVLRQRFASQRYSGVPLETRGCIAAFDGDRLTLWTNTQWPFVVRMILAEALGLPENRLRVVAPDVGGGFGNKQHVFREELLLCLLAMKLRQPVRWIEDRTESLAAGVHSREQIHDVEIAASSKGKLLAMRDRILSDIGAGSIYFPGFASSIVTAAFVPGPYDLRNYAFDLQCVVTNKAPAGAYRGFGMPEATFVMERSIDLVARQLRLDPLEVRRRNLIQPQQMPYRTSTGSLLDSGDYPATFEQALTVFDLPSFRAEQARTREAGRRIGVGIVNVVEGSGPTMFANTGRGGGYERAMVRVEPDASISVFTGLVSQGQGHETMLAQIAASKLGVSTDSVRIVSGDTDGGVWGLGTWGGRGSSIGAPAVGMAAEKAWEKVASIAGWILEAPPSELVAEEGRIFVRDSPDRSTSLAEVCKVAYHETFRLPASEDPGIEATATFNAPHVDPFPDKNGLMNACVAYSNSAHAVVIEVDPGLGTIKVRRYVVVEDCGVVINPMLVEGQLRGGLAQGIGGALLEEFKYGDDGQPLTTTLMDYLMPTAVEVPRVEIHHRYTPAAFVPGGFKGMGEGGTIGPPAAIAAALDDAFPELDLHIASTPLSPSMVLESLMNAMKASSEPSAPVHD